MRLFPCQLVLVVGVLAVAWAAIGGSIVAQESVRDGAVIAFDPPALELGEVEAGDRLMPTVKVANIVDRPVTVDYVFGSGSTTGSWSPVTPFTFGPGESIEVPFRFLVPPRQGNAFSKRICFRTDDRDHPLAVLTVNGSVPLKIAVEPDQVAACRDDPETGTITLRAVDGQAFRILHANPPIVRDLPTDRRVEHTLHIDWPAWAARGEYPVAVALVTSHPELMKATVLISLDRVLAQAGEESQEGNDRGQAAPLLLAAVRSADLAALASALEAGADVNRMYGRSTRTALQVAAANGFTAGIDALLAAGAEVDSADRRGSTPLCLAIAGGHADAARHLLRAGASIEHAGSLARRPLELAVRRGEPDLIALLLDAGADPNAAGFQSIRPVMAAVQEGRVEILDLLLRRGADVHGCDDRGEDALFAAARAGWPVLVPRLIAAGADVNAANIAKETPLMGAAACGNPETVRTLLELGADQSARDKDGRSALDWARRRVEGGRGTDEDRSRAAAVVAALEAAQANE